MNAVTLKGRQKEIPKELRTYFAFTLRSKSTGLVFHAWTEQTPHERIVREELPRALSDRYGEIYALTPLRDELKVKGLDDFEFVDVAEKLSKAESIRITNNRKVISKSRNPKFGLNYRYAKEDRLPFKKP